MPRGNWLAVHLQAVLFLKRVLPGKDIFGELAGQAPDTQEDRPKEGLRTQTGSLGENHVLQVQISPARVDAFMTPPLAADVLTDGAPTLGEFRPETEKFTEMIERWLPQCDFPVLRMALVTRALAPAETTHGAYEILRDNLTSVQVKPGEMRDLTFRVNWRASTKRMPEGYLNRLTNWASITFAVRAEAVPGRELEPIERYYAYREIDVNTPVEHADELPRESLALIFRELSEVTIRTGETGEGP